MYVFNFPSRGREESENVLEMEKRNAIHSIYLTPQGRGENGQRINFLTRSLL
jgi:hypothetical protein